MLEQRDGNATSGAERLTGRGERERLRQVAQAFGSDARRAGKQRDVSRKQQDGARRGRRAELAPSQPEGDEPLLFGGRERLGVERLTSRDTASPTS